MSDTLLIKQNNGLGAPGWKRNTAVCRIDAHTHVMTKPNEVSSDLFFFSIITFFPMEPTPSAVKNTSGIYCIHIVTSSHPRKIILIVS